MENSPNSPQKVIAVSINTNAELGPVYYSLTTEDGTKYEGIQYMYRIYLDKNKEGKILPYFE